ncbi:hypothetical protein D6817_04155, partial [Candidatus Pacearchaeota archaeon]
MFTPKLVHLGYLQRRRGVKYGANKKHAQTRMHYACTRRMYPCKNWPAWGGFHRARVLDLGECFLMLRRSRNSEEKRCADMEENKAITAREKFQALLHELFQFESADLDFGIYRIMNHKRELIEKWITEDLPKGIRDELNKGVLAAQREAQRALEEARQKVLQTLGEDAIDAEGNLAEQYHNTKVGREYLEAREKMAHARPSEGLEAQVYNHLYTFFSRYYQDGD